MKKLSQRTIVRMMEVMDPFVLNLSFQKWQRWLYENEFPEWFIQRTSDYLFPTSNTDWMLRQLREGTFFYDSQGNLLGNAPLRPEEVGETGENLLQRLAAILSAQPQADPLRRSIELDGFVVDIANRKLIPIEGPVSTREEGDRFTRLIREAGLPNESIILQHLTDAMGGYEQGQDHPSLNESRSFVQALIDDIGIETDRSGVHSVGFPASTKNRVGYLRTVGFLTQVEEAAIMSAWGVLCAGSHPGIPPRELARIGLILAIEFAQLLVLKFNDWKANRYSRFPVP